MDYHFETVQDLKLGVYDIDNSTSDLGDDDYLGGVELTLGQVRVRNKSKIYSSFMLFFTLSLAHWRRVSKFPACSDRLYADVSRILQSESCQFPFSVSVTKIS